MGVRTCFKSLRYLTDVVSQVRGQLLCESAWRLERCRWRPRLPHCRPLLLPVAARERWGHSHRPHPRPPLHHLHARLMCILLKNMDRRVRIVSQRCCQAASRATDGHERPQRKLHDPRAQPVHSNCSSLRWSLHRSPVSVCRFHGSDWVRDRNPLGCDHHLPVLRDIRQGAVRNGQHGRPPLLSLLVEHPDIIHTYYYTKRASSLKDILPPSVSQKDNPINAKQDTTILMLLNIHFFFKCQNFTSDTQLRMMLFVKTENTGKWNQFLERK